MKKVLATLSICLSFSSSTLYADSNRLIMVGYSNVDGDVYNGQAIYMDFGFRYGETIKQKVGLRYTYMIDSDYDKAGSLGGLWDVNYQIGYEVYKDITCSIFGGYAFEDVATNNMKSVMAAGFTYGAEVSYKFNDLLQFGIEYKKYDLSYEISGVEPEYDYKLLSAYIGFQL